MPPKIFTYKQAGEQLGVSERTINRWVASGALKRYRINGQLVLTRESLKKVNAPLNGGMDNPKIGRLKEIVRGLVEIVSSRDLDLTDEETETIQNARNELGKN